MDIINNSLFDWQINPITALVRNFLTLGGVNEFGDIPAWTAAGEFELKQTVNADFSTNKTYFGQAGSAVDFIRTTSATSLDIRSTAAGGQRTVALSPGLVNNKSQVLKVVRTAANLVEVYIDDVLNGTSTAFAGDLMLDVVWQKGGGDFFSGVAYDVGLTEAGGDNRFYAMSSGSTTTEPNALNPGTNDMTLNNIVAGDWELLTLVGDDWLGAEILDVAPSGTGTGWTLVNGVWISDGTGGAFSEVRWGGVALAGLTYQQSGRVSVVAAGDVEPRVSNFARGAIAAPESYSFVTLADAADANIRIIGRNSFDGEVTTSAKRILEAP